MTTNLLEQFLNAHDYDIRKTRNGRWIDQKCTMDELCFVADCVVVYLQEGGQQPFQSPDIWHTEYAIENVQKLFSKPDPMDKSTMDEYNKFFRQPLKMLAAAGVLREDGRKNNAIQFRVENEAVLEYLSLRERNCFDFLCSYITKTLKDSGLWDAFESFFDGTIRESQGALPQILLRLYAHQKSCRASTYIHESTESVSRVAQEERNGWRSYLQQYYHAGGHQI